MLAIHHPLFEETERGTVITQQQSERLARDWVEAWNRHDLDGIMAHYTDDVAFTSPFVAALAMNRRGRFVARQRYEPIFKQAWPRIPTCDSNWWTC
jgi:ketosteroid isomerase-like protein